MTKKKLASSYTLEEQITAMMAREFGPEDELGVTGMLSHAFVAVVLAQHLYAPKLCIYGGSRGRGCIMSNVRFPFDATEVPEEFIESLMEMEDGLNFQVRGKWNIFMQPAQIDMYGNMNISVIGDWKKPTVALVGARGVPDNTANGGRIYYTVNNHSTRTFVKKVDFICGAGYTEDRKNGTIKYGAVEKVFSELGIFDFDKKTGRMRLASVHTGVTVDEVIKNTGFELIIPDPVPETPAPTEEEVHYLRDIVDPPGVRRFDLAKGEAKQKIFQEIMGGTTYEMIYGK